MKSSPEGRIAVNLEVARFVDTRREIVDVTQSDFTDVSAVVLSAEDLSNGIVSRLEATGVAERNARTGRHYAGPPVAGQLATVARLAVGRSSSICTV